MKTRQIFDTLSQRFHEPRRFIQCLIGPRQVGKTTLARQLAQEFEAANVYASADLATLQDVTWLQRQWQTARDLAKESGKALLIIDEVQKIPNWSNLVKFLWDQDSFNTLNLYVLLLGSSPWLVQKGLTESLAGRFETIPVTHWSFQEMKETFGWSLDRYLYFGGYPGAAPLADENDASRWVSYINDSIIETTISRDISLENEVHKPILLRRAFQLGCNYSGQILSYTKMLGEIQGSGNAATIAHYIQMLSNAGLLTGLQKFANQPARQKASSPKFAVYNTALMIAQSGKNFSEVMSDKAYLGRLTESTVGAYLLNSIRGTQMELFYWRDKDQEVDFVLQLGSRLIAIEVKSANESLHHSGMDSFVKQFHPEKTLLVGNQGTPLEKFLSTPLSNLFER